MDCGESTLALQIEAGALCYQVLCRRHFRSGDPGRAVGADQLVIAD